MAEIHRDLWLPICRFVGCCRHVLIFLWLRSTLTLEGMWITRHWAVLSWLCDVVCLLGPFLTKVFSFCSCDLCFSVFSISANKWCRLRKRLSPASMGLLRQSASKAFVFGTCKHRLNGKKLFEIMGRNGLPIANYYVLLQTVSSVVWTHRFDSLRTCHNGTNLPAS